MDSSYAMPTRKRSRRFCMVRNRRRIFFFLVLANTNHDRSGLSRPIKRTARERSASHASIDWGRCELENIDFRCRRCVVERQRGDIDRLWPFDEKYFQYVVLVRGNTWLRVIDHRSTWWSRRDQSQTRKKRLIIIRQKKTLSTVEIFLADLQGKNFGSMFPRTTLLQLINCILIRRKQDDSLLARYPPSQERVRDGMHDMTFRVRMRRRTYWICAILFVTQDDSEKRSEKKTREKRIIQWLEC